MIEEPSFDTMWAALAVFELEVTVARESFKALPGVGSGPGGRTPDEVRQSEPYKRACRECLDAEAAFLYFRRRIRHLYPDDYALAMRTRSLYRTETKEKA